jgi:hypothetical protein
MIAHTRGAWSAVAVCLALVAVLLPAITSPLANGASTSTQCVPIAALSGCLSPDSTDRERAADGRGYLQHTPMRHASFSSEQAR